MITYLPMKCECGETLEPKIKEVKKPARAKSWESCVYQCANCGNGYSNAQTETARRVIKRDPMCNVPPETSCDLDSVLSRSLNQLNLRSKRLSFCSEFSEDAITFTMLCWMHQNGCLDALATLVGLESLAVDKPRVLLWGAPLEKGEPEAERERDALIEACDRLKEKKKRRTEPDVIVAWDSLVIVCEVKHRSPNEVKPDYALFGKYLDRPELFSVPIRAVEEAGFYELVRNWRLGHELAGERALALVNLAPADILAPAKKAFAPQLAISERRKFLPLTWSELRSAVAGPTWLTDYLDHRGVQ